MNSDQSFFLPTTKKELDYLGWDYVDVILISGDAYVDHPSFGIAIIGRILQREGLRVAILPQPNWQDDLRDFKKLGTPRLFFGISSGNMDSMVNHYTAYQRLRSDDAYTPGGKAGFRPDYATTVYSQIVRKLFPESTIILGGIEASMRRLSHYDFWSNSLKPSILLDSEADYLVYGMGEKPMQAIARAYNNGTPEDIKMIPQVAYLSKDKGFVKEAALLLHSFEKELGNKKYYGENFVISETESNKVIQRTLVQPYKNQFLVVNPSYPTLTTEEMDELAVFKEMKYAPHPKYAKRGDIPAWEMIKNSITLHRGCFGGCSFCAIAAHQGKHIASRSEKSILEEVKFLASQPYFKGHISDLGGPSANMYQQKGQNEENCATCARPSCIFPNICKNLNRDHHPLIQLYRKAFQVPGVKRITIGSGIRYDMLFGNPKEDQQLGLSAYVEEVIKYHVSGRLKVAPEHTQSHILQMMRKPNFEQFVKFHDMFYRINKKVGKNQQLIPYFISGHPSCRWEDMRDLHKKVKSLDLITEQAQGFTPTPMTYSTTVYYLGYDPYTGNKVYTVRNVDEKRKQNQFFR